MASVNNPTYCALTYRDSPVPLAVKRKPPAFAVLPVSDSSTALSYVRDLVLDGVPYDTLLFVLEDLCRRFERGEKSARAAAG